MNPRIRPSYRLPEPVDVNNPTWQGRTWQLVVDALNHIDECLDEWKRQIEEQRVEQSTWMTAARESDRDLDGRLSIHLREHDLINHTVKARRSVWGFQWNTLREVGKVLSSGLIMGAVAVSAKWLGLI
jgi:hypothetical protein